MQGFVDSSFSLMEALMTEPQIVYALGNTINISVAAFLLRHVVAYLEKVRFLRMYLNTATVPYSLETGDPVNSPASSAAIGKRRRLSDKMTPEVIYRKFLGTGGAN